MWALGRLPYPRSAYFALHQLAGGSLLVRPLVPVSQAMVAVAASPLNHGLSTARLCLGSSTQQRGIRSAYTTGKSAGAAEVSLKPNNFPPNGCTCVKSWSLVRSGRAYLVSSAKFSGLRAYTQGGSGDVGSSAPGGAGAVEKLEQVVWSKELANHVSFIGRTGKEAVVKYTEKGEVITHFSVAVKPPSSASTRGKQDDPMWFDVELHGRGDEADISQAEAAAEIMKGQSVCVQGVLAYLAAPRKDGTGFSNPKVLASSVKFVLDKPGATASDADVVAEPRAATPAPGGKPAAAPPAAPVASAPSSSPRPAGTAPPTAPPGISYNLGSYKRETWMKLNVADKWRIFFATRDEWDDCRASAVRLPPHPD
eukprot:jgi/Mesvir1/8547/Mv18702-RA.1